MCVLGVDASVAVHRMCAGITPNLERNLTQSEKEEKQENLENEIRTGLDWACSWVQEFMCKSLCTAVMYKGLCTSVYVQEFMYRRYVQEFMYKSLCARVYVQDFCIRVYV